ncbi:MAG: TIGR02757 family protein [Ignavibacterium sp.]
MEFKKLKQKLDYHYKAFDKTQIFPDPLQFLHLYKDDLDIELIGFIASVFAYGNVKQIINSINKVISILRNHPYEFLTNVSSIELGKNTKGIYHRFYTDEDIFTLLKLLQKIYIGNKSIKNLFLQGYNFTDNNLKNSIHIFVQNIYTIIKDEKMKVTSGVKFMFPDPQKGSACKRMNLFLRWMIRKDELDFGLWNEIPSNKLTIPVDTHIAKICKELKLTKQKSISWKMAEEITESLKKFDSTDPIKYDFAICHIGMRKLKF